MLFRVYFNFSFLICTIVHQSRIFSIPPMVGPQKKRQLMQALAEINAVAFFNTKLFVI
jgi:hypothetical protein